MQRAEQGACAEARRRVARRGGAVEEGGVPFGGCEGRGGADVGFDVGAGFAAGFGGGPSGGRHVAWLERIADVGIDEIETETEVLV